MIGTVSVSSKFHPDWMNFIEKKSFVDGFSHKFHVRAPLDSKSLLKIILFYKVQINAQNQDFDSIFRYLLDSLQ